MSSASLTQRLQVLSEAYRQNLNLIQELQRFPNSQLFTQDPQERRLEVANEIHQNLKDQEDTLELLRQEVSEERPAVLQRSSSSRGQETERNASLIARLNEDLKNARGAFRRAQLQAKRNADAAKKKEREELFAGRTSDTIISKREGQKKLTQDELAINAAEDVTRSLRRAHDLLTGTLSQSEFAQQTLDESSEALRSLSESYGGTTDLLKNSRGLVKTLVASQKSDTWYLLSSTYMLAGTIAWLVFRRLLYGPLWWLVYQPLKLMWWFTLASLGTAGFGGSTSNSAVSLPTSLSVASSDHGIPTRQPGSHGREVKLPPKGAGWDEQRRVPHNERSPEMVEKVGQIIDETMERPMDPEVVAEPRNTKKRMLDTDVDQEPRVIKDEL